jgi:hypothetical protein
MLLNKSILRNNFANYGWMVYLYILDYFETQEEYEICQDVIDIIDEMYQIYDLDHLPKRLNREAMEIFIESFTSKYIGQVAFATLPYYSSELIEMIEQQDDYCKCLYLNS